jgi:methyl-accepting chemotaxis protein
MSEQAGAGDQISRAAEELHRMIGGIAKAMTEQATAGEQIATASESVRVHAEQTSKAVQEQARTMKEMRAAAQDTAKQINLITRANKEHSAVAGTLVTALGEIRQITERNASGVARTRGGTEDLMRRAGALTALVDRPARRPAKGRGHRTNGA